MRPRLKCWRCSEDSRTPAISFSLINSCLTFLTLFNHQWKAGGEASPLFPSAGLNFATIISNSVGSRAREELKADWQSNRQKAAFRLFFFLIPELFTHKKKPWEVEALLSGSRAPPIGCLTQRQEWITSRRDIGTYSQFYQPPGIPSICLKKKVFPPFSQNIYVNAKVGASLSILRHKCLKAAAPTCPQGFPHFTLMNENESAAEERVRGEGRGSG